MWYRRAATMGNTGAMHNLGCLLKGVGDFDGAEEWFQYSVDGGNTSSMISLGLLRQDRGDLDAAGAWFRRAASAGVPEGTANLHELQRKMESDADLEKITFDTFGWALSRNRVRFRQWRTGDASLAQRFFERPPDFASWDADRHPRRARSDVGPGAVAHVPDRRTRAPGMVRAAPADGMAGAHPPAWTSTASRSDRPGASWPRPDTGSTRRFTTPPESSSCSTSATGCSSSRSKRVTTWVSGRARWRSAS